MVHPIFLFYSFIYLSFLEVTRDKTRRLLLLVLSPYHFDAFGHEPHVFSTCFDMNRNGLPFRYALGDSSSYIFNPFRCERGEHNSSVCFRCQYHQHSSLVITVHQLVEGKRGCRSLYVHDFFLSFFKNLFCSCNEGFSLLASSPNGGRRSMIEKCGHFDTDPSIRKTGHYLITLN